MAAQRLADVTLESWAVWETIQSGNRLFALRRSNQQAPTSWLVTTTVKPERNPQFSVDII